MLQNGAARVYAIDVGYGQLDWKLRQDERVVVMERTNVRYVESVSEPVSFVAIDVSFISLSLVLPAVKKWLTPSFDIVTLVKPQFEAGKTQVGKGGIVRDPAVHRSVLDTITTWATANDLYPHGLIVSPITGSNGNKEFLLWLRAAPSPTFDYAQTATESVA
jgi:23S rRNA (cytidine1920-2'-O)/16S rRNA (cytidine1409-2'-O)-methyltransferase